MKKHAFNHKRILVGGLKEPINGISTASINKFMIEGRKR
jgi:hypothetical protein